MQPTANTDLSDLDKVLNALSFITDIRSPNDLFQVFGLDTLPTAQKYGIVFGILTFTLTVTAVMVLLILGGSFRRIAEQAEGGSTIPCAIEERLNRPLLLERLLESQERMMRNYPSETLTEGLTMLTKMLMNIAPDVQKAQESMAALVEEDEKGEKGKVALEKKREELKKYIPEGYEANYVKAYRKCQDKPGGKVDFIISKSYNFAT